MPRPANSHAALTSQAAAFRTALLAWYRQHARALPWRAAPSLYKTVVSEFMLQQTQVKTVLPYFARWLEALPSFTALAAAPEAQILKLWEGLGYYSRARRLQQLARALVALPEPPRAPEAWLTLPGIGPYSAAAITSISFGAPAAVVDGNVVRILSRLCADASAHRDSSSAAKALGPLASALLNTIAPGDHNQAMMELGATLCLRRKPLCLTCPVRTLCACYRRGLDPEQFPQLAPKVIERLHIIRAWCVHAGRLLLHRSSAKARRLAQLYELPSAEQLGPLATGWPPLTEADALAAPGTAPRALAPQPLLVKKRSITRYQITEAIYPLHWHSTTTATGAAAAAQSATKRGGGTANVPAATASAHAPPLAAGLEWIPLDALDTIPLSGPHRRWLSELLARYAAA